MSEIMSNKVVSLQGKAIAFPKSLDQSVINYDVMTLKSVSYVDDTGDPEAIYLLRCSETNDYIASFTVENGRACLLPNISIKIKQPSTGISFQLFYLSDTNDPNPQPCTVGFLNIVADLVRYKDK